MSNVTLGTQPSQTDSRDAIHVAVLPVVASEILTPGQRVGQNKDGTFGPHSKIMGIVDPFLTNPISKGSRFWLCVLPNTISDMRHHWLHPDLDQYVLIECTPEESEKWLRNFIAESSCPSYEILIAAATGCEIESVDPKYYGTYDINDEYLHFDGRDAHGDIPLEFWDHVENATGLKCPHRPAYFSCQC